MSSPSNPQPRPAGTVPAAGEPAATDETVVRRHQIHRHRGEGQWAKGHFTPLNGNEQVKKEMSSQALDAAPGTPEDFGKLLSREVARWGEVVQKAGLTVEQ